MVDDQGLGKPLQAVRAEFAGRLEPQKQEEEDVLAHAMGELEPEAESTYAGAVVVADDDEYDSDFEGVAAVVVLKEDGEMVPYDEGEEERERQRRRAEELRKKAEEEEVRLENKRKKEAKAEEQRLRFEEAKKKREEERIRGRRRRRRRGWRLRRGRGLWKSR